MMFLELTFNDASSVRDYLERRSIKLSMSCRIIWHDMLMSQLVGFNRNPFIWYDEVHSDYHLDICVEQPMDAYNFLPRYKWDKCNDGLMVFWSSYSSNNHGVHIRRFDETWLWNYKVLRKLIEDRDRLTTPITLAHDMIDLDVYRARNIREYIQVYPQTESKLSLFELEFHNVSHLVSYLEAHEKDNRISIVHYMDYERGRKLERYPLIIRQESPYDEQVSYFIDVWAKSRKDLHTFGYHADVYEIKDQGLYDGKPSCKYYAEVCYSNGYKYFPMHEGHYRFRTYEPDWTPDQDKTYMLCARGNGKSFRQLKEAFEQCMSTGNPIVAVDRKVDVYNKEKLDRFLQPKPILRFDDLDEKTLKYIDTDVTACVEYYSNKDIKERMNIMFGLDLNKIQEIKDVKFNNPATIVFWADGTKTVVKRQKGDRFDKEKGLAMAIVKKLSGNKGNYNELFKKWIKEDK